MANPGKPFPRAATATRLSEIAYIHQHPHEFVVGDIVMVNPLLAPVGYFEECLRAGVYPCAVVLEIVPNMREFVGKDNPQDATTGQGLRMAMQTDNGHITISWYSGWMYVIAPKAFLTDTVTADH